MSTYKAVELVMDQFNKTIIILNLSKEKNSVSEIYYLAYRSKYAPFVKTSSSSTGVTYTVNIIVTKFGIFSQNIIQCIRVAYNIDKTEG